MLGAVFISGVLKKYNSCDMDSRRTLDLIWRDRLNDRHQEIGDQEVGPVFRISLTRRKNCNTGDRHVVVLPYAAKHFTQIR